MAETVTWNGMAAESTTYSKCLDLFGVIGASRGTVPHIKFQEAYEESPEATLRILQWARDVRGGAGERNTFRELAKGLVKIDPGALIALIPKIPELGRWDDLFVLIDTKRDLDNPINQAVAEAVAQGIVEKNPLCGKWMPRKGPIASWFQKQFGFTPKGYRKTIVALTNVVEQKMCANLWDQINFSQVPSIAQARYSRAFARNASEKYAKFQEELIAGTAKVNAGAIFPYDIIRSAQSGGNRVVIQKQWESQPNYLEGNTKKILPMIDVSGSMEIEASRGLTCMDVAVSLGIYLAQRQQGPFKDHFLTFHSKPSLLTLEGDWIGSVAHNVKRAPWGGNTNIIAAFDLVLDSAVSREVAPGDMPDQIIIFSDMQFDQACGYQHRWNFSAIQAMRQKYRESGYKMPEVVFWNLNGKTGNFPVKHDENGTAMVSGFSPSLLKSICAGNFPTPLELMFDVIGVDRYKI